MIVEKAFLGCLIEDNELISTTCIQPHHLENPLHQMIYRQMIELADAGKSVSILTFTTLNNIGQLGGISYINELACFAELDKFSEIEMVILEAFRDREKQQILKLATYENWDIERVMERLSKLNDLKFSDYMPLSKALMEMMELPGEKVK